jgi:outer membrane lipoprotein-sorting protein
MSIRLLTRSLAIAISIALLFPMVALAESAQEILEDVVKKNFEDSFRVALEVKTLKDGKMVSEHELWLMGKKIEGGNAFFLDFDKPEESKGLRILFRLYEDEKPQAYMYLPSTKKTLPLSVDDKSADIGGTGMTVGDFHGFIPRRDAKQEVVKEEKVDGRECFVIKTTAPENPGHQLIWITKQDRLILKTEHYSEKGKMERSFEVTEFFKTEKGQEFPREETIKIPGKNTTIKLRQENAVFGVEIADELMDPKSFGEYKWRI